MTITQQPKNLIFSTAHWEVMREDVERRKPNEACGLLAGYIIQESYKVLRILPTQNMFHSPTRYQVNPEEQLKAFNKIEEEGWELLGIYHSHPDGPETPSQTDISEAYYPGVVHLIWSRNIDQWNCRGFLIQDGSVIEVPVMVEMG
jgi:proteasome lid subunit RPN8/RPN11